MIPTGMARAPESGPEALEHALGVLATISGRPLTDEGLSRTASEIAGYLVVMTQGHETAAESARHAELDVENPAAAITVEMVMRIEVCVIAGGSRRAGHFFEFAVGDEHVEIAVNGPE